MPPDTPHPKPALELQGVSKQFGDFRALVDVSLRVEAGDSVLLYGPNGAGKTTLLRILATLVRPTEGKVFYNGADIHMNLAAGKTAIGFASHATFLYGELSAFENLEFTGRLFGLRDLAGHVAGVLELFHLRDRAATPVRELSRGYQQRVALARAFLHDPQFLLLDEPFTGLDAASVEALEKLLKEMRERGKAFIFSTHDFKQGAALADRLVALEAGKIRFDGPVGMAPLATLRIGNQKLQARS